MKIRSLALLVAGALIALPSAGLAKDRTKAASPITNPGTWFPSDRYPADAKRAGQQGRVTVEIAIDKAGAPTACKVVTSSGFSSLDTATCDLAMANAKFAPATDKDGRPVESTYVTPGVRWVLGTRPPITLDGPWRIVATLQIDQEGKISSCKEQRFGPAPGGEQPCVSAKAMPPKFGLYVRGGSTVALAELVMEVSLSFDGTPGLPMTFETDGRETLQMGVTHFEVDALGKVNNCQVEAQSGMISRDLCNPPPGPFLPIEKARGVTVKFAMSRPAVR